LKTVVLGPICIVCFLPVEALQDRLARAEIERAERGAAGVLVGEPALGEPAPGLLGVRRSPASFAIALQWSCRSVKHPLVAYQYCAKRMCWLMLRRSFSS
jgi:hypothetical protein